MKTAEQHIRDIDTHRSRLHSERHRDKKALARLRDAEDLRDDVMSLVKNSGLSYGEIYDRLGPCRKTLESWSDKSVRAPQLGTIRATLRIPGKDLGIVEKTR